MIQKFALQLISPEKSWTDSIHATGCRGSLQVSFPHTGWRMLPLRTWSLQDNLVVLLMLLTRA